VSHGLARFQAPPPAEGQPNRGVADQSRREPLGNTDLGGQRACPPTRGLAERPRTLVQACPQGLAGPSSGDGRHGVRSRRWRRQPSAAALVKGMNGVAHGLIGAVQVAGDGRGGLPRSIGEEHLAAAHGTGGRGPEPVFRVARSSAVSGRTTTGVCIL
jgi:hypothetical protein